ncbi:hypothetical protein [Rhodanobacter geophilus]|uniref:PIN domain-containing protein n=1 Tax=Rhodanobacter geophilus TaxID=3162488 RepID=A0ABV3QN81_9GAMM
MCIVVDPPLFISIFKSSDPDHYNYSGLRSWIKDGPGKLVLGGSLYKKELSKIESVLNLISNLERSGKTVSFDDSHVDKEMRAVKKINKSKDFDDPHLAALVRTSLCRIVATRDKRSHKHLTDPALYKKPCSKPKIYGGNKNNSVLCKKNIATCCK